ncbi:MAG: efflux RND transporter permease subunit [Sphaerochaetaceae bacterium]
MKTKRKKICIDIIITLIFLMMSIYSLSLIDELKIDSSTDVFIPQDSQVVAVNDKIELEFGSLDSLLLSVHNEQDGILHKQTLTLIDDLTNMIRQLPEVESVRSITSLTHLGVDSLGLEAQPLFTGTQEDQIRHMADQIESWKEVYHNSLISKDLTFSSIVISMKTGLTEQQQQQLIGKLDTIVTRYTDESSILSLVGLPVIKREINTSLVNDLTFLAPIAAILIFFVLTFSLKRPAGILLSFVPLLVSSSVVIGIMVHFSITFTMATMLVPVLLLIVSSAYAIHVMSHFYEEIEQLPAPVTYESVDSTLASVIRKNRKPIILAGMTTAAGFLAQLASPLRPFRMFGLLSAFGILISQLGSLFLLPSLIRLTSINGIREDKRERWRSHKKRNDERTFKSTLVVQRAMHHTKTVVILSVVICAVTIALVPHIKKGTNMIDFFTEDNRVVKDTEIYSDKMGGSGIINVMFSTEDDSSILTPSFLLSLQTFSQKLTGFDTVGSVQSIIPYIKRMNLLMNQNRSEEEQQTASEIDFFSDSFSFETEKLPSANTAEKKEYDRSQIDYSFDEIPSDPKKYFLETRQDLSDLISQYLILYSGNLSYFINDTIEPDAANITIIVNDSSSDSLGKLKDFITSYWNDGRNPNIDVAVGGGEAISLELTNLVTKSQIYSLVISLVVVFLILLFLFRSLRYALAGLIPVVFALAGIFSSMAVLSIRLDIVTSLLAALAIGIGVDYSIHYIFAYQRLKGLSTSETPIAVIMKTTGKAIIINVLSVTIGFAALIFSRFIPIRQMGILFCISMIFAGCAALIILPVTLVMMEESYDQKT